MAGLPVEGIRLDVIQASKSGASNHAVWTHGLWMERTNRL